MMKQHKDLLVVAFLWILVSVKAEMDDATFIAEGCNAATPVPVKRFKSLDESFTLFKEGYEPHSKCEWHFEADIPFRDIVVVADVTMIDLEASKNCRLDYLKFISFTVDSKTEIGNYCGQDVPRNMPISSILYETLKVEFNSDQVLQGDGFEVLIKPVPKRLVPDAAIGGEIYSRCGLDGDHETIEIEADIDDQTKMYRNNEDITYTIIGVGKGNPSVTFDNVNLEQCTVGDDVCACDFIEVKGAASDDAKFCSATSRQKFAAKEKELRVRFKTDGSRAEPNGFKFTVNQEGC